MAGNGIVPYDVVPNRSVPIVDTIRKIVVQEIEPMYPVPCLNGQQERQRRLTMDDRTLLSQIARGDTPALDLLMERYRNAIYHTAYHIVGDWADAEDVVQEVFLRVLSAAGRFQGRSEVKTWLFRITVNIALNWRRRLKRWLLTSHTADHQAPAIADSDTGWLMDEIRKLPAMHRTVLVLKYLQDLTDQQIAEAVGCPVGTVKSRLHHGLHRLKRSVREQSGLELAKG
jgi:RNA polymerase sigma-70 factor, ECF subfamily